MEKHEEWAPAKNARVKAHEGEVSGRLETTDVLTRRVRAHLRIERPPGAQTYEQRTLVARVAAALDIYTNYFYPPDPRE